MAVWSEVRLKELTSDLRVDADYYRPEYLEQEKRVKRGPYRPLLEVATVSDGNHLCISEEFVPEGVRYLRGQDLQDFFIADTSPIYIPQSEYQGLKRSHMHSGDVLVGIVGTIGSVGLVTDRFKKLTGSCKLAILRPFGVSSEYLAAYLLSKVGQWEMTRRIRGAVQMGLILPDLRELPVPLLNEAAREKIAALVRASYAKREEAKTLYEEAEGLLIESLGINNLDLSPSLFYERPYREVIAASRADAEYYQPKYLRLMNALKATHPEKIVPLDECLSFLTNGHTPLRHDLSVGEIHFLTAEHVFDFRVNYDSDKRIARAHHEGELRRTQLQEGDFLITIKGRIGNAAIVEDLPVPTNINQDVALFRLKDGLPPYYLLAYLNSIAGQSFSEQYCTGQINPFLGLGNLRLLPVPVYDPKTMEVIAERTKATVLQARASFDESRRLLEDAKRTVEAAIAG